MQVKSRLVLFASVLLIGALLVAPWQVELSAPAPQPAAPLAGPIYFAPVASGLSQPLFVTHAGDDRLFIVEKGGKVKILQGGALLPTPFLTLSVGTTSERGLLGLAFEPNYASTGRFYVNYTDASGDLHIARLTVQGGNPNQANAASLTNLLTIAHSSAANHNGGWIGFGPDGFLYIAVGDGGDQGDPNCNGQTESTPLASLLRINVVGAITYTVPLSNSFRSGQFPALWAWGLRNPWRNSFDRQTGDLYIGDVGAGSWEEIDYLSAGSAAGSNFGWNRREGPADSGNTNCLGLPNPAYAFTSPVLSYSHSVGNSITGGYVYRGSRYPWLWGTYFFADYGAGKVFTATQTTPGSFVSAQLVVTTTFGSNSLSSWGEGADGELYLTHLGNGMVYRLETLLPGTPRSFLPTVSR